MTHEAKDLWSGLDSIDFSQLDGPEQNYPTFTSEEIADAYNGDPLSSFRLKQANEFLREVQAQAEGARLHEKQYHEGGWKLTITTPRGQVGLYYPKHGCTLFLGYPKEVEISDETIMNLLGVKKGFPVKRVDETTISHEDIRFYDKEDMPVKIADSFSGPVFTAFQEKGQKQWAKFIGDQGVNGGRVWVDQPEHNSDAESFEFMDEFGMRQKVFFGFDMPNSVSTFPVDMYNLYAPDGPSANPEDIRRYRDRFIDLASEIAFQMGGAKALTVDFGFVLVPEDFDRERYHDINWLKKDPGPGHQDRGSIVQARKGDSIVVIDNTQNRIPITLVRIPIDKISSPQALAGAIKEDFLHF